jgi:hypothetical protein
MVGGGHPQPRRDHFVMPAAASCAYGLRLIKVPQFAEIFRAPPGIISVASQMLPLGPTAAAE